MFSGDLNAARDEGRGNEGDGSDEDCDGEHTGLSTGKHEPEDDEVEGNFSSSSWLIAPGSRPPTEPSKSRPQTKGSSSSGLRYMPSRSSSRGTLSGLEQPESASAFGIDIQNLEGLLSSILKEQRQHFRGIDHAHSKNALLQERLTDLERRILDLDGKVCQAQAAEATANEKIESLQDEMQKMEDYVRMLFTNLLLCRLLQHDALMYGMIYLHCI